MKRTLMCATAAVAALTLALSGCGSSSSSGSASSGASSGFVLGALFPQTGSLAYMSPQEEGAVKLALKDINDAGGVLGKKATSVSADTSDADHADQNTSGTQSVLSKKPSAIIGPASSSVVKNVYKEISAAKVPLISMGATSASLSGVDPYFFRTVAPDSVQGAVLGNVIAQDGVQKLAIASFNDDYGTGLRDTIAKTAEAAGVDVVYGADQAFDPTETNFSSLVSTIKASNPDAIAIIAFDQTKALIKEMISQGIDTTKLYLVDGNTSDYSDTFDKGTLKGVTGTIPGAHATADFQKKVKSMESSVKDYTYAAETYDGVILFALAAQKGGKAAVCDVLRYGEILRTQGLNLLQGPGNDGVSCTALATAGVHMVLFSTGRGTPFATVVPTIKISTNTALYEKKHNWIDFNAGAIVDGESFESLAEKLLDYVVDVASGKLTLSEKRDFHEIVIWKDGVTL